MFDLRDFVHHNEGTDKDKGYIGYGPKLIFLLRVRKRQRLFEAKISIQERILRYDQKDIKCFELK